MSHFRHSCSCSVPFLSSSFSFFFFLRNCTFFFSVYFQKKILSHYSAAIWLHAHTTSVSCSAQFAGWSQPSFSFWLPFFSFYLLVLEMCQSRRQIGSSVLQLKAKVHHKMRVYSCFFLSLLFFNYSALHESAPSDETFTLFQEFWVFSWILFCCLCLFTELQLLSAFSFLFFSFLWCTPTQTLFGLKLPPHPHRQQ